MLSLAQEILEDLTARNTENKKDQFNRPFVVLFLNTEYWLFFNNYRNEIRSGWVGLC